VQLEACWLCSDSHDRSWSSVVLRNLLTLVGRVSEMVRRDVAYILASQALFAIILVPSFKASREIIPRPEEEPGQTADLTGGDIDLTCR
jgi:hypothetical protein